MEKSKMKRFAEEVKKRVNGSDEDTMDVCVEISMREGLSEKETRLLMDLSFIEKLNKVEPTKSKDDDEVLYQGKTRGEMIERMVTCLADINSPLDCIKDMFRDGVKGLKDKSDDELIEEYCQMFEGDEEDLL